MKDKKKNKKNKKIDKKKMEPKPNKVMVLNFEDGDFRANRLSLNRSEKLYQQVIAEAEQILREGI